MDSMLIVFLTMRNNFLILFIIKIFFNIERRRDGVENPRLGRSTKLKAGSGVDLPSDG